MYGVLLYAIYSASSHGTYKNNKKKRNYPYYSPIAAGILVIHEKKNSYINNIMSVLAERMRFLSVGALVDATQKLNEKLLEAVCVVACLVEPKK